MNTKVLIDAMVRQTTVLIAQLSTAAGIRAPLAHIADQVFLELSREIEAQGVSRKVAADMFGLAIRTYQKKVQRVTESASARDKTLWQAVIEYLQLHGSVSRRRLEDAFIREEPVVLSSVISDLVSSGLVSKAGSGASTVLGMTPDRERERTWSQAQRESLGHILWAMIYRSGRVTRAQILAQLPMEDAALDEALANLMAEGRVTSSQGGEALTYSADSFLVPVDSELGWEAAVFDHYQAMVQAISSKVRSGTARSSHADVTGGATLTFDLGPDHPFRERALGLLQKTRTEANALWEEVQAYNATCPLPDEGKLQVTFYFGQSVKDSEEE